MAKCTLKRNEGGGHEVWGPNGLAGQLDEGELRDYAKTHLGMQGVQGLDGAARASAGSRSLHVLLAEMDKGNELQGRERTLAVAYMATPEGKTEWECLRSRRYAAAKAEQA